MLLLFATMFLQFPVFAHETIPGAHWSAVKSLSSAAEADRRETLADATAVENARSLVARPLAPEFASLGAMPFSALPVTSVAAAPLLNVRPPAQTPPDLRTRRLWLGLTIAAHSGAAFDAWSTRRLISAGGQELNPIVRPFAGNASLYVATQIGPTIWDYLGQRMMNSRHLWIRRCW
jgi:hypothetical protein